MVKKQAIRQIHIESDSYCVLQMITRGSKEMKIYQEMGQDIRALIREFDAVWISFCYREVNHLAYGLALLGKDKLFLYNYYDHLPPLLHVASDDMNGVSQSCIGGLCNITTTLL